MASDWEVTEIAAADTHGLRRSVLRGGDPDASVDWPEDERSGAIHLGVKDPDGEIVAVASFSEEAIAHRPDATSWRLRGMAVAEAHQGRRLGKLILDAAIEMVRERGATLLWCNARDSAMAFYAREGFATVGDGFNTDETGLAHHVMLRDL